ncbi:hypothetical protein ACOMHN_033058 [Nucella lapillus]
MLGEERWRDRCDRYFSSINDIRKEADAAAAAAAAAAKESARKQKKDREAKRSKSTPGNSDNTVLNNAAAAAAKRTIKQTTKKTTMKKTTEDGVIIRAHGRAYRTKHRPFKGPRRWLSSLDLHGTSMLQRTESAVYFFVWLIIITGGCVAMGYFLYLVIRDYLGESSHFGMSVSLDGFFHLGLAVSVCNLNPLRKNHISNSRFAGLHKFNSTSPPSGYQQVRPTEIDLLLQKTQFQRFVVNQQYSHLDLVSLLNELKEEYAVYGSMRNEEDWDSLYAASTHTGHYDVFARALRMTAIEMSSMGHHMKASMLQCVKNGYDCDQRDVTHPQRVIDYGNCVTINVSSDASTWFESLSLIFDVEPEEYVDYITSSLGMRVFLHLSEGGFWRSIGYLAPVGSAIKLNVAKNHLRRSFVKRGIIKNFPSLRRHEENQVRALTTESLPEFDDLSFNWYTMQNQDSDRKPALAPMMTTETELTPPAMAPNLQLGLDPIVEESDVDIRAVDGAEEDNLYTHAWERSGQSRPYTRVLVSGKDANISDAPMLNAPGNHGSLRSEMYRATTDSPPSASQMNAPRALMGPEKQSRSSGGGNYILKSRAPYTWHSAHFSTSSPRQTMMTPADFINVYGQPARQLYEDDSSPPFYLR